MASNREQIGKDRQIIRSRLWWWYKRQYSKRRRRDEKRDPENALKRPRYEGYVA